MVHLRKNYIGDEEQIKRINSKIGKYDTLVVLGDVGDIEWVRKIRGYKVLVMCNHDAGATKYKRKIENMMYYWKYYKEEWNIRYLNEQIDKAVQIINNHKDGKFADFSSLIDPNF